MADEPRAALERLIAERGEDYVGLSRLIGRNPAYIQQYIKRGVPKRLAEEDRRQLARYFGVSEELLGGPAPSSGEPASIVVPRLDVGAAAGSGAVDEHERQQGHIAFSAGWLKRLASGDPSQLSIIRVEGDSMYPLLAHRDEILVDRADGAERLRDGIYVLRRDDALIVKRLALNPASRRVSIKSENGTYPSWPECDPATLDIVGRVIWAGRVIG